MNRDARELVALAEQLGFTLKGYAGSGHPVLAHPSGAEVTIPATASDWRSRRNAIAQMERISGQKLPRAKSRRSRKADQQSGFSLASAAKASRAWHEESDAQIDALWSTRDALIADARAAARDRGRLRCIPKILAEIESTEGRLRQLAQAVEPFDPFELAKERPA